MYKIILALLLLFPIKTFSQLPEKDILLMYMGLKLASRYVGLTLYFSRLVYYTCINANGCANHYNQFAYQTFWNYTCY
jgi:hypothetical protein